MANIRTLTYGYDKSTRTYASPGAAALKAKELVERMQGTCNAQIVPVVKGSPLTDLNVVPRYTVIFSCFENIQDAVSASSAGFHAFR